jgi:hypothetical protein
MSKDIQALSDEIKAELRMFFKMAVPDGTPEEDKDAAEKALTMLCMGAITQVMSRVVASEESRVAAANAVAEISIDILIENAVRIKSN